MSFDANTSKIAITVPQFTLLKHVDGILQKYCEPFILSMAIDAAGAADPAICFNYMAFPKVARGGTVTMLGDGHLVYGPKNPGDFVAVSVLIMENDEDINDLGKVIESVIASNAVKLGFKAIIAAAPGHAAIVGMLKELTTFVAGVLRKNKADELYRIEGCFLKGHPVPYHINHLYELENNFIKLHLKVIPLQEHDGVGLAPTLLPV